MDTHISQEENRNLEQEETRRIIIEDMVKKRHGIVPIIGDDTIVYVPENSSEEVPFQKFIVQQFQKKYPDVKVDNSVLVSMKERGYYGLTLISQKYNKQGRFLDDFMGFVEKNKTHIKLRKEVHDFLVAYNFPIIITTISFDIIESVLNHELECYQSVWYKLNKENSTFPPRCVYHIFGQAKDGSKWVSDEDLLLMFLLSHNYKDNSATGLIDYLNENEKKMLVLGCNLPNWLFRFLWQPTHVGRNINDKTTQGYWINKEKPEDSFENFLKKKNFSADDQMKDILIEATRLLQQQESREVEEHNSIIDSDDDFDVFISYASEDKQVAKDIFEKLKNIHVKAWFDEKGHGEITPGSPIWDRINNGIIKSTHFMPIITENWMKKMTSTSGLKEETDMAHKWFTSNRSILKDTYSIPVIIKGFSFNGSTIDREFVKNAATLFLPRPLFEGKLPVEFDKKDFSVFEKIVW